MRDLTPPLEWAGDHIRIIDQTLLPEQVNIIEVRSAAAAVEAMNRLVKALIELGSYLEARAVLEQVCEIAPYNNIAKKNRARLDQLAADPSTANPGSSKKAAGVPQIFIEESGKSGTTILRNTDRNLSLIHI